MPRCVSHYAAGIRHISVFRLLIISVSSKPIFCSASIFVVREVQLNFQHSLVASHFKCIDFVVCNTQLYIVI